MSNHVMTLRIYFPTALLLVCLDQLSKYWARNHLFVGEPLILTPFLDLMLGYNPGAAFGMWGDGHWWQLPLLISASIAVSVLMIVFLWRLPAKMLWRGWAFTLLLAGALGNLVDRVLYNYVTDFISLHWGEHFFPTFNLADSMISMAILLILTDFKSYKENETNTG